MHRDRRLTAMTSSHLGDSTTRPRYYQALDFKQRHAEATAQFACPLCSAPGGEVCRARGSGAIRDAPHFSRQELHQKAWEERQQRADHRPGTMTESPRVSTTTDAVERVLSDNFSGAVIRTSSISRLKSLMGAITPQDLSLHEVFQILAVLEQAAERIATERRPACSVVSIDGTRSA
jgi:hypothetical protein